MVNEDKYDGNLIACHIEYLKGRKTRVKYKNWVTKWRKPIENLLQGQTDSTILFDLMLNYIDLTDVDKIIKIEVEKTNDEIGKKYDLDKFNKLMKQKQDESEDINITTINQNKKEKKDDKNNENRKYNQQIDIDWKNLNSNMINDDDKTIKIGKFQAELKNFADDCTLEMTPLLNKCQLTKMIKYGYRLNLQHGMNQFYNWTRYYQLVLPQAKCNTVTFSRKQQQFHAYVYQSDGNKLEIIHSYKNAPQQCKHHEKLSYINPLDKKIEGNGDSDLENLDNNGKGCPISHASIFLFLFILSCIVFFIADYWCQIKLIINSLF